MNHRLFCTLALAYVLAATHHSQGQSLDLIELEQQAIRNAVEAVADSIVQIETLGGLERVEGSLVGTAPTTGLIVSTEGHILSSAINFVQQPASILVTLPSGKQHAAEIVARDGSRMLVLLKIETTESLQVAAAAARDSMRVGQTTVAVGKVFDAQHPNLSVGILSADNRIWGKAIQTDAKVSPTNYGGPLINLQGEVLGILVPLSPQAEGEFAGAEWYDSGIGFAVPLVDVYDHLDAMKSGNDLASGKLGIALRRPSKNDLDPETVLGVVQLKSPAASAGLKPGDRIREINGQAVARESQLKHALGPLYAGDSVSLVVVRGEEELQVEAVLVDVIPPFEHAFLGILPGPQDDQPGVPVRYVYPESPANELGIQVGDRLTALGDNELADADAARLALANLEPQQETTVSWGRGGEMKSDRVALSRLPETIPDTLPPREPLTVPREIKTGPQPLQVPEEPNECLAYVPESLTRVDRPGLLVVLIPPGDDAEQSIEAWKETSEQHQLVVLVPKPQDAQRWQRTEAGFVQKVVEQAMDRFAVDPQRIVMLGREGGGGMAYFAGLRMREIVRGIVVVNATLPQQLTELDNQPLQRLAFILVSSLDHDDAAEIDDNATQLREWRFPVTKMKVPNDGLSAAHRLEVGRWIDSLDRL